MAATVSPETALHVTDAAWETIRDGYDLQVHVAPDVVPRRIDDIDLAKEFLAKGLRGFVLKSHYVQTGERAQVVTKAVPGIQAFGALTLNHSVGGINPVAVELAGRSKCKIVWFPTVDAANETAGLPTGGAAKLPFWAEIQREIAKKGISPPSLTVLDKEGAITKQTSVVLELIAHHDMILATGHLGRHEIFPLVKAARAMKVRKILVTHAEFPSQSLEPQEQKELADLGAQLEHCFTTMFTRKARWEKFHEAVRMVGPERTVLSTDLGQSINPPVSEGFAAFAQNLLNAGFAAKDVRRMAVTNPAALVA